MTRSRRPSCTCAASRKAWKEGGLVVDERSFESNLSREARHVNKHLFVDGCSLRLVPPASKQVLAPFAPATFPPGVFNAPDSDSHPLPKPSLLLAIQSLGQRPLQELGLIGRTAPFPAILAWTLGQQVNVHFAAIALTPLAWRYLPPWPSAWKSLLGRVQVRAVRSALAKLALRATHRQPDEGPAPASSNPSNAQNLRRLRRSESALA